MNLKVENLYFRYEKKWILENITIEAEKSLITAILGPNGSGKSTLIKCINGLLTPQKGQIKLGRKNLAGMSAAQLAKIIAYVPQKESRCFPASVFEIILMGRKPHLNYRPGRKDKEKAAAVIEELNLEKIAFRDFNSLSGGQQQKVLIARALAQEPELLLFDEPTSSLDLKHQLEVMEVISAQTDNDVSALIAMHDLTLAGRYCDQFVILNQGKIHSKGGQEVINCQTIAEVYGVEAEVRYNGGRPVVTPLSSSKCKAG